MTTRRRPDNWLRLSKVPQKIPGWYLCWAWVQKQSHELQQQLAYHQWITAEVHEYSAVGGRGRVVWWICVHIFGFVDLCQLPVKCKSVVEEGEAGLMLSNGWCYRTGSYSAGRGLIVSLYIRHYNTNPAVETQKLHFFRVLSKISTNQSLFTLQH